MLELSSQKLFDFKTRETETRYSVNLYRSLCIIGAVSYPLFYFIFRYAVPGTNNDSLPLRLLMSALCISVYAVSYSKKFVERFMNEVLYIVSFSAIIHYCYLLWLNNFNQFYYIGFLLLTFILSFTFKRVYDLWAFVLTALVGVIISSLLTLPTNEAAFYHFTTGLLLAVVSIFLSQKIQSEAEINLGTFLLESLYQESPDAIIIVEKENDYILRLNRKAQERFNVYDEEEFGWKPLKTLTGVDLKNSEEKIQQIQLSDSKKIWVNVARENFSIHGEHYGIIRILDVSEEKQLNDDLKQAVETAESASKAKESFLANVSHEIRTPMNGIIGLTSLLQKTKLDDKQTQYINAVKQSGEHLLVIINDLLDFSKIVAGQMEFEHIEFDLSMLLYNINQTYGNRAIEKGIYLKIDVDENIPNKLQGDPVRLNQVLVNLLGNSIKFTEQGGVSIHISNINSSEKNPRLQFTIRDTGIGIAPDKLETVFTSFKQARSDTARKYGGTGLGLSIVKKLVDAQNGKVWVESEIGKGSDFIFELSFEIPNETKTAAAAGEVYHKLKGVEILLAEDNVVNQLLANDLITEWDANIDIADNGEIAINKLRKKRYDLVLMDVQMPVVNGLEATEIIRKYSDESISHIPIIAMTASAIKGDSEKCIAAGMTDYITKPFNALDLNNKIWMYLSEEKRIFAEGMNNENNNTSTTTNGEFNSSLINLNNLKDFSRGKTEFMVKMLNLLITQTPPAVEQIGTAIPLQDWDTVRSLSHKMKPNIGLLGNPELDVMILKLEKNSDGKTELENIPALYEKFMIALKPAIEEAKRAVEFYASNKA